MDFVRVPKRLITDSHLSDKRVLLYASLLFETYRTKSCNMSDLTSIVGYSLDRHKNGAIQQLRKTAKRMNGIYLNAEWLDNNSFTYRLIPYRYYGIIYEWEYKAILDLRKNTTRTPKPNHAVILLVLSWVRSNMDSRTGHPKTCYAFLKTIKEETGLTVRAISNALTVLEQLEILHTEEPPHFLLSAEWRTAVKIFANRYCFSDGYKRLNDYETDIARTIESIKVKQHQSDRRLV